MERGKTWKSVVVWSIISAAFIGPGTVTTAVSAGSQFGLNLLWAVTFSTLACLVLQEVAARITVASGMNVGQALVRKFGRTQGWYLQMFIGGSVILGCAAYEAGNILGGVAGLQLITGVPAGILTVMIFVVCFFLLWFGNPSWISTIMMFLVAIMGIGFFALAFMRHYSFTEVTSAAVLPNIPVGSQLLVLGLVGTTVVPYNVFLGSGISKGQTLTFMRVGLTISVLIGGLITGAILVAGTAVTDFSSFSALFSDFEQHLGSVAAWALASGLFAAGFSSALTSPYAASVIVKTALGIEDRSRIRIGWIFVLCSGFAVAISGVKPIPVILLVQALNGLILPFLVIFLILVINDEDIIPAAYRHGLFYNIVLLIMLGIVVLISLNNIDKVATSALALSSEGHLAGVIFASLLVVGWTGFRIFSGKR